MTTSKLMLDYVYEHESQRADFVFLTQPYDGGQVKNYTWRQTLDESRRMATYLQAQGFEQGARIAMLAKNSAHFIMAELAIWMAGYTTVAIFPTETAETIRFVLEHSGASMLFVGKLDTFPQQKSGIPDGLPCIALPLAPANSFDTWEAIIGRTAPMAGKPHRDAHDIALLLYTSGSTGTPKGVMHSFTGATESGLGFNRAYEKYTPKILKNAKEIRVISYLPLSHIFERGTVECVALIKGDVHVFFAENLDTFVQDIQRARPHIFASVPRLWLKFQHGVFAKMPAQKLSRLLSIPLLGKLVARKVLKGLGLDQTLLAASGSAPIPAELITWYRKLGLNLMEGYGMTEDFCLSHMSTPELNAPGYVGAPHPNVSVKLSEEGEILIKSPARMVGYYKQPELDKEAFTPDGFFRTGDKGERLPNGLLKVTGRVKEMFKTSKGKYVAPAPIENLLNIHPMVELSLVSGVGQPAAYALVNLSENLRPKQNDPAFQKEVEAELTQLLKQVNAQLVDYEKLQLIVVAREPWTIENGFLTPTMKIRRSRIEAAVTGQVDGWFSQPNKVLWA